MNLYRHISDKATLEREYSPSSCVADISVFLREYARRSEATRAQCVYKTYQYGTSPAEQLDFFPVPVWSGPRPVLIYIHGGYWQELSKSEHSFPAPELHERNIGYIAINYGLAPAATLEQMMERCRAAVLWVHANSASLGIDPEAIDVAGGSAGAHLAAMTALSGAPIRSLTLLSGVFDLRPLVLTYVNDKVRMTADSAMRASPLLLMDAAPGNFPPTQIVWGRNETSEFKRQSREFADAITRKGGMVRMLEMPNRNHFDLVFDVALLQVGR